MKADEIFQGKELCTADFGGFKVLDCLRWPTPLGSGFRMTLTRGSNTDALSASANENVEILEKFHVGKNPVILGAAPKGEGALQINGLSIDASLPETGLFDELNVLLALRHSESIAQILQWLDFHIEHHDANALLLFDRNPIDESAESFEGALRKAIETRPALKRVVLVRACLPLGQPERPALGHRASAPRSKDRSFTPAPWCAPLFEPALYDALKWRFLTRAGAVVALNPFEYAQIPEDGVGIFAQCRLSHTGFVPLLGEQIFPWRIKKGKAPEIGDHICRTDPPAAAAHRWAVAAKRFGGAGHWLPNGIVGARPVEDEFAKFDLAVSLVFQDAAIAELVPKEVLDLDPKLHLRATEVFESKPVLPPEKSAPALVHSPSSDNGRAAIVTCMKNEGPFLLEWIAYHRMVGFDDFLVYTNDCDDGTDGMLDRLQELGIVQRRDNPFRQTKSKPQQAALEAASAEGIIQDASWVMSMDVDEFVNIHVGEGKLADLWAKVPDANTISMTWRLFGNSDVEAYSDRPIISQFSQCAPKLIRRPHQAWGFKTLFRNAGHWERLGVHRPHGAGKDVNWVNGSGHTMPERMLRTGWRSAMDSYGYDLVTLNHYAVRSVESFLVKRERGRVNHVARGQGEAYWFRMNNNDEQDFSIQRHIRPLEKEIALLKEDPILGDLHAKAVEFHRAKITKLRADTNYSTLYEKLCGERMKRLSRLHRHFGLNVFLHGPSVIPDEMLASDLPPNHFFNVPPPEGKMAE